MATAKITLFGMYKYMQDASNPLFTYLNVPAGIDKNTLINNILMRGGEFEVLYGDPDFMQARILDWSNKWMHTMERWVKALSIDYEPLENYDRKEEWLDKSSKVSSSSTEEVGKRNETAVGNDTSSSSGSGNTTNTRSAFDASDYQPHDKSDSSSTGNNTSSSMTSANGQTYNDIISNNADNGRNERVGRAHGNIGVTTSQQMLEAELDVARWNIYDEISDLFVSEFCIFLY